MVYLFSLESRWCSLPANRVEEDKWRGLPEPEILVQTRLARTVASFMVVRTSRILKELMAELKSSMVNRTRYGPTFATKVKKSYSRKRKASASKACAQDRLALGQSLPRMPATIAAPTTHIWTVKELLIALPRAHTISTWAGYYLLIVRSLTIQRSDQRGLTNVFTPLYSILAGIPMKLVKEKLEFY
jgi:hypothetical protein